MFQPQNSFSSLGWGSKVLIVCGTLFILFLTTREKFISNMVNKISMVPLSQEECWELIKFFAGHKLHFYTSRKMEYTSYQKEMWELTEESGVGYNAFSGTACDTMLETRL